MKKKILSLLTATDLFKCTTMAFATTILLACGGTVNFANSH